MNNIEKTIVEVNLSFKEHVSALTGRPGGVDCYFAQVEKYVESHLSDFSIGFEVFFPKSVKIVSGSYLLGMFENIVKIVGIDGIKQRFDFVDFTGINLKKLLIDELKRSGC